MKKILFLFVSLFLLLPSFATEKQINNLNDYFEYLPNKVHANWTPYKANKDYSVAVQFRIKKNGEISDIKIVSTTNENANTSVINAVKSGAPYKPLPESFKQESVRAQIELNYMKN